MGSGEQIDYRSSVFAAFFDVFHQSVACSNNLAASLA